MKDIFSEAKQNAIQKIVQEDAKLKKAREEEIKKQQENLRRIEIESSTEDLLLALKPFFDELTVGGFEIISSSDWKKDISVDDGDGFCWKREGYITKIRILFHEENEFNISLFIEIETIINGDYKVKVTDFNKKDLYGKIDYIPRDYGWREKNEILTLLREKILEELIRLEIQKNRK